MRLRLSGITEVLGMLDRAGKVDDKVGALRRDFAIGTHANILRAAPIGKTGYLRSAAMVLTEGDDAAFVDYADYARYVDLGTGRRGGASYEVLLPEEEPVAFATYWPGMAAQPFMRGPVAESLAELEGRIDEIAREIG